MSAYAVQGNCFARFAKNHRVNQRSHFNKSWGATQNLDEMCRLARRIKATGAALLIDIHYSDTWADPANQTKPRAWTDLPFASLETQVHDYTATVLKAFEKAGATPDIVQVGNEIAGGMLWPDGKVLDVTPDQRDEQWRRFARLLRAGCSAVREAATADRPIRIMLHIHGGGRKDLPVWFFSRIALEKVDFDLIGLSVYPAFSDSLEETITNLHQLAAKFDKDILIVETSYPWKPQEVKDKTIMRWPHTPEGQKQFIQELTQVLREVSNHRGAGFVWWYPEAVPTKGLHIWKDGAEALFDEHGNPLPAMQAFEKLK